MNLLSILRDRFQAAQSAAFGGASANQDPQLLPASNPRFGDFQANLAMSLARTRGENPRVIAEKILQALELEDLCLKTEIAGPGFINLFLRDEVLTEQLKVMASDDHLGLPQAKPAQRIIVDYSSPNVAKEMHVGHLRSSIIGDSIARILSAQGHEVHRQNHLGDWGTQFGMLIELLLEEGGDSDDLRIKDLNELYKNAKKRDDADPDFALRARKRVVALQAGEPKTKAIWRNLIEESKKHFNEVYALLGVLLNDQDIRAESFYNDKLPGIVGELAAKGLLQESQGADAVFPGNYKNKQGDPLPVVVRKADGGYLYATTDLAALKYRLSELEASRIICVTDSGQSLHFAMLFDVARLAGWLPNSARLEHVAFGRVLGNDGKKLSSRNGGADRLQDLLNEGISEARRIIQQKSPELPETEAAAIARAVGIGAIKYADLSSDKVKDYIYDRARMLAFEGNTAPYLLNAHVRIHGIFRKAGKPIIDYSTLRLTHPIEHSLALLLLRFPATVEAVAENLELHRLCTLLYEIAAMFHKFFENCPVLREDNPPELRRSRLALCDLTARILAKGLNLLGIESLEKM